MLQTYTMILWAKAKQEDFETSLDKAYRLLIELKEFGNELGPNYLPARRKKDTKKYELNYDTLKELIKKEGVNTEGGKIFDDLGYHLQFFSSLKNKDSAGINITIGMSNTKFVNSFIVHLPLTLDIIDEHTSERLITLFKKSVILFDPYWGSIVNSFTLDRLGIERYHDKEKPTSIHWVNFWDNATIEKIALERIQKAPLNFVEKIDDKGYILVLQKTPIDDNSEQDIEFQKEVNKILGL
jgi:hypothetical protein